MSVHKAGSKNKDVTAMTTAINKTCIGWLPENWGLERGKLRFALF